MRHYYPYFMEEETEHLSELSIVIQLRTIKCLNAGLLFPTSVLGVIKGFYCCHLLKRTVTLFQIDIVRIEALYQCTNSPVMYIFNLYTMTYLKNYRFAMSMLLQNAKQQKSNDPPKARRAYFLLSVNLNMSRNPKNPKLSLTYHVP